MEKNKTRERGGEGGACTKFHCEMYIFGNKILFYCYNIGHKGCELAFPS